MTAIVGARLLDCKEHFSPRYLIQVLDEIRVMLPSHDKGVYGNGCGQLTY